MNGCPASRESVAKERLENFDSFPVRSPFHRSRAYRSCAAFYSAKVCSIDTAGRTVNEFIRRSNKTDVFVRTCTRNVSGLALVSFFFYKSHGIILEA